MFNDVFLKNLPESTFEALKKLLSTLKPEMTRIMRKSITMIT